MGNHKKNTVKLKDSKDQFKTISVIVGIIVSLLPFFISWRVSVHTEQVEETKQLNNYLDKLNEIIIGKESEKETKLIHDRPAFAFKLEKIKEIDYLTRAYTRNLNSDSRRVVLIYLYESGLINHRNAVKHSIDDKQIGLEGVCGNYQEDFGRLREPIKTSEEKLLKQEKLTEREIKKAKKAKEKIAKFPHCNLSTNRYYLNDIDMSNIFLENIKLHYSYLDGANFTAATLNGATFRGSGFRKANFTKAELEKVDFSGRHSEKFTVLKGANFTEAVLEGANFLYTNLSEANFTDADLTKANLTKANLTNVKLQGAIFGDAQCTEQNKNNDKNLNCANLYYTTLEGAKDINIDEIKKAYNWRSVKGNDIRKELGLPIE
ncbi:MAG: pentapeptide repeat-containing protein [Crocosphaera sp.]|nr:pentapeptide repeat-containing protein [Crocosphaera sp.]